MVRRPMQSAPEFHEKMKRLQKEIMKKKGEFLGFPKIQKEIIKMPEWELIEKRLLEESDTFKIRIKLDRRTFL